MLAHTYYDNARQKQAPLVLAEARAERCSVLLRWKTTEGQDRGRSVRKRGTDGGRGGSLDHR